MKIHTPFDVWRAGFVVWIAACDAQIALGTQIIAMMRPARSVPVKVLAPSRQGSPKPASPKPVKLRSAPVRVRN